MGEYAPEDQRTIHKNAGPEQSMSDWHELEKQRFAADIADLLCELAHRGLFSGIVLVAAPRVLGFCGAHPVIP